ncbi:MAG: phenylalanine--tRNA ligase subunit beta [Patescibacteria group bacterium]|nr:phenylalanine--tRNA ligase subunit beta [Patescibacteria group bacterium]
MPQKIAECLSLCGPSVEALEKTKADYIYHLEVTTNRVDMMSVLGIAREAAASLPQFGLKATLKNDLYKPTRTLPVGQPFPLKLTVDSKLCPRFTAVVIGNVTIKPSPPSIRDYLEKSGIRSLNNVVDISNYLMRAYGQPVHTFDLDKITAKMVLRLSRKGETITTLDEKTFTLPGGDIVIEDGSHKLIDLCGIMGGASSAVDENTKNVLLFVQTYSASHIRRTSMLLGQRSEAAQIFEKQPDPELVMPVILKGIKLFKQLTGGEQASQIIDLYPAPAKPKIVNVPLQLIRDRLGVDIAASTVDKILESLGFINGRVPSWRRHDINIPEDIVEEVARIYGYHRLPSQLMTSAIPTNYPSTNFYLEAQIKHWLVGFGLTEIYTNSLVSQNFPGQLKIKNALSEDWQYLRRSLIPSHTQEFPAFEMANTYHPRPGQLPEERFQLLISGFKDFAKLKGIVDALFAKLHLPVTAALTPTTAVIDLEPVIKQAKIYPAYRPVSAFAPVIEDLTFTLPAQTYVGPVLEAIKASHRLIASVKLTKTWRQNFTFTITYQSLVKSLSAQKVAPVRKKIVSTLKTKVRGTLVGHLD